MKKNGFKKVYFFFSSVLIFLVHIPFVFAKSKPSIVLPPATNKVENANGYPLSLLSHIKLTVEHTAGSLYDSLRLNIMGLSQQAFDYAMKGFNNLIHTGKIPNENILSIVDFSKPSSQKRLFVIDLQHYKVLFNTYVAHGRNSGREFANEFSNSPESNKSSLGFYETENTYFGNNGYSLRLEGLERGINDNAGRRDIVIHGAPYVNEDFIRSQGYIGRSQGCPALPPEKSKSIIDKIKNGTCLFIYSPQRNYLGNSRLLNS
jgi:hypothetical protein